MSTSTQEAARTMRAALTANHYGDPAAFLRGFLLGGLEAALRDIPEFSDGERVTYALALLDAYHEVQKEIS